MDDHRVPNAGDVTRRLVDPLVGAYVYCRRCRIPKKHFDNRGWQMLCNHPDELACPEIFSTGSDDWRALKRWNREHPDRPVLLNWQDDGKPDFEEDDEEEDERHSYDGNLAYSDGPSPYRVIWPKSSKE